MQIYSERRAFMKKLPAILFAAAAAMVMCSCGDADISSVTMEGEKIKSASKGVKIAAVTDNITKTTGNPLISNIFCADPTAVEYEGRLYVYNCYNSAADKTEVESIYQLMNKNSLFIVGYTEDDGQMR